MWTAGFRYSSRKMEVATKSWTDKWLRPNAPLKVVVVVSGVQLTIA